MTQRGRSTERANSPRRAVSPHPSLDPPSPDLSPVRNAPEIDEYVADLEVTRRNLQAAIDAAQENCPLVAEIITNIKVYDEVSVSVKILEYLSVIFRRPEDSIFVSFHQSATLVHGTVDAEHGTARLRCFILKISAHPNLLSPRDNDLHAAEISRWLGDYLGIDVPRTSIMFLPLLEHQIAIGGRTVAGAMEHEIRVSRMAVNVAESRLDELQRQLDEQRRLLEQRRLEERHVRFEEALRQERKRKRRSLSSLSGMGFWSRPVVQQRVREPGEPGERLFDLEEEEARVEEEERSGLAGGWLGDGERGGVEREGRASRTRRSFASFFIRGSIRDRERERERERDA
ncbi:hypothetical protein V490_01307 [Pseudogymnoascus sp. VKM F-3557]|nr:hypothetical protein V490_01307 [Pseudogymnoascus sp. VKM F-3557]